jgi:hypothetical protein
MDYCSIDDAFPAVIAGGGTSAPSGDNPQQRKKTRKNRHGDVKTIEMPAPASIPIQDTLNTPDREAYRKDAVPGPLKSADEAGVDGFSSMGDVAELIIKGETRPSSDENWFGAIGGDDYDYMPYTGGEVKQGEYSLQPDFAKTFMKSGGAGLERAAGIPFAGSGVTMEDQWKPLVRENLGALAVGSRVTPDMSRQISDILKRLDQIEGGAGAAAAPENANMEVLMFTMSGIFVMFLMDVMMRAARR